MNDVTITDGNGNEITYTQDQIVRPKFDCCYSAEDYTDLICTNGLVIEEMDEMGVVTTTRYCGRCICQVVFTRECDQ